MKFSALQIFPFILVLSSCLSNLLTLSRITRSTAVEDFDIANSYYNMTENKTTREKNMSLNHVTNINLPSLISNTTQTFLIPSNESDSYETPIPFELQSNYYLNTPPFRKNVTKCHFNSSRILTNGTYFNCGFKPNNTNNNTSDELAKVAYRYFDPVSEILEEMSDDIVTGKCVHLDNLCDLQEDCLTGMDESLHDKICGMMPFGSMCNFETDWCGWINEEMEDAMQWSRRNGPYYDESTGPEFDHTFLNTSGHYLYVTSAGGKYRIADRAILRSTMFHLPFNVQNASSLESETIEIIHEIKNKCKLRFWYHMFGPHTGVLEVKIRYKSDFSPLDSQHTFNTFEDKIWKIFNRDENEWIKVEIPLFRHDYIPPSFYLEFVAKRGILEKGDVAIDDVSLSRECFLIPHSTNLTKSANVIAVDKSPKISMKKSLEIFEEIENQVVVTSNSSDNNQTEWSFNTCGNSGRAGPYLLKCNENAIEPLQAYHKIVRPSVYSGIQLWIAPKDGYYQFNLSGASGGKGAFNLKEYGKGASVSGVLELKAGQKLFILVGQKGQDACDLYNKKEDASNTHEFFKLCKFAATNQRGDSVEFTDYYQRRKLSGGGGGGGGASYIFTFNNQTRQIELLFVAAGGGGASTIHVASNKYFSSTSNFHLNWQHGKAFSSGIPKNDSSNPLTSGIGFANSTTAGAGGGWFNPKRVYHHPLVSGNNLSGHNLIDFGGLGGKGQACGNYLSILTRRKKLAQITSHVFAGRDFSTFASHAKFGGDLKKDEEYYAWPVDGGFGGGGASCSSGGGGGGFLGGDASYIDSMESYGEGGLSYINSLIYNPKSYVGFNDGNGYVKIEATLLNCPCSHSCSIVNAYSNIYKCSCPVGMLLNKDRVNCESESLFHFRVGNRRFTVLLVIAGLIAFALTSALCFVIVRIYRNRNKAKVGALFNGMAPNEMGGDLANAQPYQSTLLNDSLLISDQNGVGVDKRTKALWDAFQHELQIDRLRLLSNRIPDTLLFKRLLNFKSRLLDSPENLRTNTTVKELNQVGGHQVNNSLKISTLSTEYDLQNSNPPFIKSRLQDTQHPFNQTSFSKASPTHISPYSLIEEAAKCSPYKYASLDYSEERYEEYRIIEIPRDKLQLIKTLGEGAFGQVFQGILQHPLSLTANSNFVQNETQSVPVAVKTLPEHSHTKAELDFLLEASIMSKFNHENIVKIYGACLKNHPKFIVLEYLPGGDLKNFLREIRLSKNEVQKSITINELLNLALDIAKGCQYLEQNHFVHRDIAARNCLLTTKQAGKRIAKIADFGMSRDIYRANYYRKSGKAMLPVKWMPPEAYLDGLFTSKSDIWAFGVLLWELFTLGYMPYPGKGNQEVMVIVAKGERLKAPAYCPSNIRELMSQCCLNDPSARPNFLFITNYIEMCLQDPSSQKCIPIGAQDLASGISLESPPTNTRTSTGGKSRGVISDCMGADLAEDEDAFVSENDTGIVLSPSLVFPESSSISGSGADSRLFERKNRNYQQHRSTLIDEGDIDCPTKMFNGLSCRRDSFDKRGTKLSKTSQSTSGIGGSSLSCGSNCGEEDLTTIVSQEDDVKNSGNNNAFLVKQSYPLNLTHDLYESTISHLNLTNNFVRQPSDEYLVPFKPSLEIVKTCQRKPLYDNLISASTNNADDSGLEGYENMEYIAKKSTPFHSQDTRLVAQALNEIDGVKPINVSNADPSYMIFAPVDFSATNNIKRVSSVPCEILNRTLTPPLNGSNRKCSKVARHLSRTEGKSYKLNSVRGVETILKNPNCKFIYDNGVLSDRMLLESNSEDIPLLHGRDENGKACPNIKFKSHFSNLRSKSSERKPSTITINPVFSNKNSASVAHSRSETKLITAGGGGKIKGTHNKIVKSKSFNQHFKNLLIPRRHLFNLGTTMISNCEDSVDHLINSRSFVKEVKAIANNIEDQLLSIED